MMRRKTWIPLFVCAGLVLSVAGFFTVRRVMAAQKVESEWRAEVAAPPALQPTNHLEIIPLFENDVAGSEFAQGHGVSYLVRTDQVTVLMDAGDQDDLSRAGEDIPFERNLRQLGISWDEIDAVVISHLHPDHTGGVDAWRQGTLDLGHAPTGGLPVYVPGANGYPGAIWSDDPTAVGVDIVTTGGMPYVELFPVSLFSPTGFEQSLLVNVAGKGLVMISGCGHPGLEKMVARATGLYHLPLAGVVGGLHYADNVNPALEGHIQFLQSFNPGLVGLSPHDSGPKVLAAFETAFPGAYQSVAVGSPIQFP